MSNVPPEFPHLGKPGTFSHRLRNDRFACLSPISECVQDGTALRVTYPKGSRFSVSTNASAPSWEQRKLSEVAVFDKGVGYSKSDISDDGEPLFHYGRLYTKHEIAVRKVDTFAAPITGALYSNGDEVITPASGETAEDIAVASAIVSPGIMLGGGLNIVRPSRVLNSVFVALSISYGKQHEELAKRAQGKSVVHLYNDDLRESTIVFPSLKEQNCISDLFLSLDNLITLHQRKQSMVHDCGICLGTA